MTPRQQLAYMQPCFVAEDTTNRRYAWLALPFSVVLTANVGLE